MNSFPSFFPSIAITEQYGGISLAFWWASAAFNMWLFIVFPQNVSKTNMKLLFLFESVIAWILPAFFIGVQFSLKGKDTFTLQPFCHDCMGLDEQVLYFFYILQVQIVTGLAGFFISWFIYKKVSLLSSPLVKHLLRCRSTVSIR